MYTCAAAMEYNFLLRINSEYFSRASNVRVSLLLKLECKLELNIEKKLIDNTQQIALEFSCSLLCAFGFVIAVAV